MRKVFIVGACRTPIGKMGGALSSLTAVDLGSLVISEALKRSGIQAEAVDHVYMGCVIQAGLGQNVVRQARYFFARAEHLQRAVARRRLKKRSVN